MHIKAGTLRNEQNADPKQPTGQKVALHLELVLSLTTISKHCLISKARLTAVRSSSGHSCTFSLSEHISTSCSISWTTNTT